MEYGPDKIMRTRHGSSYQTRPRVAEPMVNTALPLPPGAGPSAYSDQNLSSQIQKLSVGIPRQNPFPPQREQIPSGFQQRQPHSSHNASALPPHRPVQDTGSIDASHANSHSYSTFEHPHPSPDNIHSPLPDISRGRVDRYADADAEVLPRIQNPKPDTRRAMSSRPSGTHPPRQQQRSSSSTSTAHTLYGGSSRPVSEATAYARAVSSGLATSSRHEGQSRLSPPPPMSEHLTSRPLPRPPSKPSPGTPADTRSNAENSAENSKESAIPNASKIRPSIIIPRDDTVPHSSFIDFTRSPTLPPLIDPRENTVVDRWAPLTTNQLPTRSTSVSTKRFTEDVKLTPSSARRVGTSPIFDSPISTHTTKHPQQRSVKPPSLATILSIPQVQASVLSYLSINSFLSLTGSSELVRKRFTGELVGKWVMGEWGLQVEKEKGRSWPNLTVWEGFLESLLHDPASYSTYPSQWHNLLRHLSLSHTLVVLHLRELPASAFPLTTPLPFEEDGAFGHSHSVASLSSLPRSRVGSDAGSVTPAKMPPRDRVMEIVMPEPLAGKPESVDRSALLEPTRHGPEKGLQRRSSISSITSAASFSFGRKRSGSTASIVTPSIHSAGPVPSGKAALPPVSYPSAKRYGFKRHGAPSSARSRTFSENSRPGSIMSAQSSPSVALSQWMGSRNAPIIPPLPLAADGSHRASLASSEGKSIPRFGSPIRRDYLTPPPKIEPAFDRPPPLILGRAPILRVFVPLSDRVKRWPSAEGAAAAVAELDKCGATHRLRLGDLVVNTACRQPKTTEHVLLFVPFVKHLLVPLEYRHSSTGHLPAYLDAFAVPPSYYYPFLPSPQIVYLDLRPYAQRALQSLRLAFDRRDMTVASGSRVTAKRYLHVAGFEIGDDDPAAAEWRGMVSLEADGTAEGKREMQRRFQGLMGPWEIVREKSMSGTVWLRLVQE